MAAIDDLAAAALASGEPQTVAPSSVRMGGVDPLGLRQINFELMDRVLPGLNNVARHVRPFTVVSWAWRRAHQLADARGTRDAIVGELVDFVDRVEVMFVASQMMLDPTVPLPGNDYLKPLLEKTRIEFSGSAWEKRRKDRRYSTSLSAPINYGPGLTALGWLGPHFKFPQIKLPTEAAEPALDALERELEPFLKSSAFKTLGPVTVRRSQLEEIAEYWRLDRVSKTERNVMKELLFGAGAPLNRQRTGELMLWCAQQIGDTDISRIRAAMAGNPTRLKPPAHLTDARNAWRRLQVRQLFRLSLEAMFYWSLYRMGDGAHSVDVLVRQVLKEVGVGGRQRSARLWLDDLADDSGPVKLMEDIQDALRNPEGPEVARTAMIGLASSLAEPDKQSETTRPDRLPLARAFREEQALGKASPAGFVQHVLESWILAQHGYWSVGRGLADARAGGRTLLRLRVILDEGGWMLTPGSSPGNPPMPTPDRLGSALSLADECGLLE